MTHPTVLFFEGFSVALGAVLITLLWRTLTARAAGIGTAVLMIFLGYGAAIGASGILRDPQMRPPGIAYLVLPQIACILIFIARGPIGRTLAYAIPLPWILGLQVFRVGVEASLQMLHEAGQVPALMTFSGGNVEILVGLTAPLVAWASTRGTAGRRLSRIWTILGLLSLLNIVLRGVLTAPGPLHLLHTEVPNLAMGRFPFSLIPGFMVPLAVILHLLALRRLGSITDPGDHPAALQEFRA